jgi:C4-dicarboxylate transporter DctQ subunit
VCRRESGGEKEAGLIERLFERLMRAIEHALALAFIFAVCLNFANVIGRYVLGRTMLGADEVQMAIMVWMTFLGAAAVTWRNIHLRMDILAAALPPRWRTALTGVELVAFGTLAGFALVQSARYVEQMIALDRRSDVAGIPMWMTHSAVAVGFGLMLLMVIYRLAQTLREASRKTEASPATVPEPHP